MGINCYIQNMAGKLDIVISHEVFSSIIPGSFEFAVNWKSQLK